MANMGNLPKVSRFFMMDFGKVRELSDFHCFAAKITV